LLAGSFDTGGRKLRQLEVMETVTDKNGRFHFPDFIRLNISLDDLGEEDPQVLVFKPGYQYYRATNDYPIGSASPGPHRASSISGKKLAMRKVAADPRKQASNISFLTTNLERVWSGGQKDRIKRMLQTTVCESIRLYALDPNAIASVLGDATMERNCASSK
jgi:hypothetical protein